MKKLLSILLAAIPVVGFAQESDVQPTTEKTKPAMAKFEAGVTGGLVFDSHIVMVNDMYIFNFNTGSFFVNLNKVQIGAGVDVDFIGGSHTLLAPHLIVNKTHQYKKGYFYAGGMAGFARMRHEPFTPLYVDAPSSKGFIVGLQAGVTYNLGKHFALNAETGVRSLQLWVKEYPYILQYPERLDFVSVTRQTFDVYFPSKIGIRYRFGY